MRKFEKVSYSEEGILPTRGDVRSAGYDLYSAVWYNSKEAMFDYLKNQSLCLNNTVLLEYDNLYLQKIINNKEALELIRKVILN